ncbi:unnamed protein product, partial [Staurois parvus]
MRLFCLFFDLTCSSIQPRAVFPASVMALGMTAGCPVRMSEKYLRFVIGPAASGICRVPGTALPFTKSTAFCACALGTRLS